MAIEVNSFLDPELPSEELPVPDPVAGKVLALLIGELPSPSDALLEWQARLQLNLRIRQIMEAAAGAVDRLSGWAGALYEVQHFVSHVTGGFPGRQGDYFYDPYLDQRCMYDLRYATTLAVRAVNADPGKDVYQYGERLVENLPAALVTFNSPRGLVDMGEGEARLLKGRPRAWSAEALGRLKLPAEADRYKAGGMETVLTLTLDTEQKAKQVQVKSGAQLWEVTHEKPTFAFNEATLNAKSFTFAVVDVPKPEDETETDS